MIFKNIQLNTPKVSEVKADFRNYVNKPEIRKTVHKFLSSVFIFNNVKSVQRPSKYWEYLLYINITWVHAFQAMSRNTVYYGHRLVHWYKIMMLEYLQIWVNTKFHKFWKKQNTSLTYLILYSSLKENEWEELKHKLTLNFQNKNCT